MGQCSGCPSRNICRTGRFPCNSLHSAPPQQPACTCLQGASHALNPAHPAAQRLLRLLRLFSTRKKKKKDLECLDVSVSAHLVVLFQQRANCFFSPAGCVGWLGPCIREPQTARTSPQKRDCLHGWGDGTAHLVSSPCLKVGRFGR